MMNTDFCQGQSNNTCGALQVSRKEEDKSVLLVMEEDGRGQRMNEQVMMSWTG